jgi:hypothetical protein
MVPCLTLAFLNEATQAWVEHEYNRKRHAGQLDAEQIAHLAIEVGEIGLRPRCRS